MTHDVTVFRNGRILTMDPRRPELEELVVIGELIADRAELARRFPDGEPTGVAVDLGGRTVVPGLIDAHHHLSLTSLTPRFAALDRCTTFDEIAAALREQAAREPGAAWIRGELWEQPVELVAAMLDELQLGRPVIVAHSSIHQCVVDTVGLEVLGITTASPDPEGGRIVRDSTGRPTGLLVEAAWSLAHERSIADYTDPDRWADLIVERCQDLLRSGVTSVHDAACPPEAEAVYASLAASARLPVSVVAMPHPQRLFDNPDLSRLGGPVTGSGDHRFRIGAIKLFADGGISMAVDAHRGGRRRAVGTAFPGVVAAGRAAAAEGFGVAIHAMGNAGLDLALATFDAIAADGSDPPIRRVEHLALTRRDQLDHLAAGGISAVVQPGFVPMLGRNVGHVVWDDATWLPFRSAIEAGVRVAASTDAPCAGVHPLETSCHGALRRYGGGGERLEPDESVDYTSWLRAWTREAAAAGGQEAERGELRPGMRADLVVLDGALDPEDPPRVAATWVAGRQVAG